MKKKLFEIFAMILSLSLLTFISLLPAYAAETGGASSFADDGVIVGILIFLIVLFMAALVFLGAVLMKTKRK